MEINVSECFRMGLALEECKRRKAQMKTVLSAWREHLIQVLKGSPYRERKFVRWKASVHCMRGSILNVGCIVERGELEVLPERPL